MSILVIGSYPRFSWLFCKAGNDKGERDINIADNSIKMGYVKVKTEFLYAAVEFHYVSVPSSFSKISERDTIFPQINTPARPGAKKRPVPAWRRPKSARPPPFQL